MATQAEQAQTLREALQVASGSEASQELIDAVCSVASPCVFCISARFQVGNLLVERVDRAIAAVKAQAQAQAQVVDDQIPDVQTPPTEETTASVG